MRDVEWLASLLARTPMLAVDVAKARKAGDAAALAYHAAMVAWRDEAALALAEVEMLAMGGDCHVEGAEPLGPLGKFFPHLLDRSPSARTSNDRARS